MEQLGRDFNGTVFAHSSQRVLDFNIFIGPLLGQRRNVDTV